MADARPDFDDGANILTDGVVTVGEVATPLVVSLTLDINTEYINIQNLGNSVVWIGSASVAVDRGLRLTKNQAASLSCKRGAPLYAVVIGGTNDVYIAEMGC